MVAAFAYLTQMKSSLRILCYFFFATGLSGQLYAQQNYYPPKFADTARMSKIRKAIPVVDRLYQEHARRNNFPGMAYGLIVDGKLLHTGVAGYSNLEKRIPVTSNSVFRIASMSKSVTAVAILQLRDQGKLQLDDAVKKYIPEFNSRSLTADAPQVTIRHLLIHAGGFPEDNPWGDRQLADTDEELISLLRNGISWSNVPGVNYEYSNLGFAILGLIVKNVSGMSFENYVQEKIFKPLRMTNSAWEYSKVPENLFAQGYRYLNEKWNKEETLHHGSWGAMGGMLSSIDDFSKYISLHLEAWPPRDGDENQVLRRSSIREMHQPYNFSGFNAGYRYPSGRTCAIMTAYAYGLGWLLDCEGRTIISHSGGLPGYGSQWRMMPEYGIAVVGFANSTYAGFSTINLQVLDTLIRLADLKPRLLPTSDILKERKDQVMEIIPGWNDVKKMNQIFAENFFPDYVLDSLKKTYAEIFSSIGPVKSVSDLAPLNQLRGSFQIVGEKGKAEVFFTLNEENPPRIQQMHIRKLN